MFAGIHGVGTMAGTMVGTMAGTMAGTTDGTTDGTTAGTMAGIRFRASVLVLASTVGWRATSGVRSI